MTIFVNELNMYKTFLGNFYLIRKFVLQSKEG